MIGVMIVQEIYAITILQLNVLLHRRGRLTQILIGVLAIFLKTRQQAIIRRHQRLIMGGFIAETAITIGKIDAIS